MLSSIDSNPIKTLLISGKETKGLKDNFLVISNSSFFVSVWLGSLAPVQEWRVIWWRARMKARMEFPRGWSRWFSWSACTVRFIKWCSSFILVPPLSSISLWLLKIMPYQFDVPKPDIEQLFDAKLNQRFDICNKYTLRDRMDTDATHLEILKSPLLPWTSILLVNSRHG